MGDEHTRKRAKRGAPAPSRTWRGEPTELRGIFRWGGDIICTDPHRDLFKEVCVCARVRGPELRYSIRGPCQKVLLVVTTTGWPIPSRSCARHYVFRRLLKHFCAETSSARAFAVHFGDLLEQLLEVS